MTRFILHKSSVLILSLFLVLSPWSAHADERAEGRSSAEPTRNHTPEQSGESEGGQARGPKDSGPCDCKPQSSPDELHNRRTDDQAIYGMAAGITFGLTGLLVSLVATRGGSEGRQDSKSRADLVVLSTLGSMTAGVTGGVYLAGRHHGGRGSLFVTALGASVGLVAGLGLLMLGDPEGIVFLVLGPTAGAIAGYELTNRTPKSTAQVRPIIQVTPDPNHTYFGISGRF